MSSLNAEQRRLLEATIKKVPVDDIIRAVEAKLNLRNSDGVIKVGSLVRVRKREPEWEHVLPNYMKGMMEYEGALCEVIEILDTGWVKLDGAGRYSWHQEWLDLVEE